MCCSSSSNGPPTCAPTLHTVHSLLSLFFRPVSQSTANRHSFLLLLRLLYQRFSKRSFRLYVSVLSRLLVLIVRSRRILPSSCIPHLFTGSTYSHRRYYVSIVITTGSSLVDSQRAVLLRSLCVWPIYIWYAQQHVGLVMLDGTQGLAARPWNPFLFWCHWHSSAPVRQYIIYRKECQSGQRKKLHATLCRCRVEKPGLNDPRVKQHLDYYLLVYSPRLSCNIIVLYDTTQVMALILHLQSEAAMLE